LDGTLIESRRRLAPERCLWIESATFGPR